MRFLQKFVPKETPLVLIGHSIGSYMALQITDKLKDHNVSTTKPAVFSCIESDSRADEIDDRGHYSTSSTETAPDVMIETLSAAPSTFRLYTPTCYFPPSSVWLEG